VSILTKFFGRTASEGAAFALGTAVGPALSPAVREIVNEAWEHYPTHPLSIADAALIAAEDRSFEDTARAQAKRNGVAEELFDKFLLAVREGPGLANAFALWRRSLISEQDFDFALWKAKIAERFHEPIKSLRNVLLSPADLAMMRQQGFIDVDRQHAESALQGVTAERADLLFEISGLPPGIEMALEMLRRQIIDETEFARIVREGHTKTKYTDELLALRTPLLAAATLVNLYLRGWITEADYHNRMAEHGFTAAQADDWYDSAGRPAAPVQMFNAWARGAPGPYGGTFDHDDFIRGIRQSDIRPEYGETLWALRWNYPSLFQLRRAVQDGGISRERALEILHIERYERADAVALVDSWLRGAGTTSKGLTATDLATEYEARWLTRAQYIAGLKEIGYSQDSAEAKADAEDARRARLARNRRIDLIGRRYVAHGIGRDQAVAELNTAEVPARVRDSLLPEWDAMRELTPDALTAAQIKKAFKRALITRDEAIARLEAKGYDEPDANIYLDE
jgi:hypothetical protein